MPYFIEILLLSDIFEIIARLVLTSFFWIAGIFSVIKFNAMAAKVRDQGLRNPSVVVALMIVTEFGGSLLLITDVWSLGWLGAGWLGVFTFLSIPLGHPFWKFDPPKKIDEMQVALEHISLIGGLMAAAALTIR